MEPLKMWEKGFEDDTETTISSSMREAAKNFAYIQDRKNGDTPIASGRKTATVCVQSGDMVKTFRVIGRWVSVYTAIEVDVDDSVSPLDKGDRR